MKEENRETRWPRSDAGSVEPREPSPRQGERVRLRRTRGTVIAVDYHSSGETFTRPGWWQVTVELDNGQRWSGRWAELKRL